MRILVAVVIISVILIVILIALTFFCIDMSGHRGYQYDLLVGGELYGTVRVDRYVTGNKIVYKSNAEYFHSMGYPALSEKLFLKKKTITPLKFVEESTGTGGQKRLKVLVQNGEVSDYLFLEHPRYITLKGFETGNKTMVFSPDDVMLYMPIMEKYNFWKKGTQFFEVMIPADEPFPPLRDKLGVRYLDDEYIPIMGRRAVTESFSVKARGLPEAKIYLSKYTHIVLALEVKKLNIRYELINRFESPGKRVDPLLGKLRKLILFFKGRESEDKIYEKKKIRQIDHVRAGEEIFFESDNLILSGRLWIPDGKGPFPAVLAVPKDGPMTRGEYYLLSSLGESLSSLGIMFLTFDSQGQGKSQGSFVGLDEKKKLQNIADAADYLMKHPAVRNGSVNLLGHEGGAYFALKAASGIPSVRSSILLGVPLGSVKTDFVHKISREDIQAVLASHSLGPFDEGFMKTVGERVKKSLEEVTNSREEFLFFMGTRVPLMEYREFIARRPYKEILSFDRPMLLIFGRDDRNFNSKGVETLKRFISKERKPDRVAVLGSLGPFMGDMVKYDDSWSFAVNKDVLELIRSWILEHGTAGIGEPVIEDEEPWSARRSYEKTIKNII
ncbi:MAG: hypothetical protein U9R44_01875 [Candidatus Omnitrophota bacterium]|nr:hypothetical protein [Candidatus Omnitrophota bacterium]